MSVREKDTYYALSSDEGMATLIGILTSFGERTQIVDAIPKVAEAKAKGIHWIRCKPDNGAVLERDEAVRITEHTIHVGSCASEFNLRLAAIAAVEKRHMQTPSTIYSIKMGDVPDSSHPTIDPTLTRNRRGRPKRLKMQGSPAVEAHGG